MLARSVTQLRSEHGRAILYHLLGNMATIIAHDKNHGVLRIFVVSSYCLNKLIMYRINNTYIAEFCYLYSALL